MLVLADFLLVATKRKYKDAWKVLFTISCSCAGIQHI